MSVFDVITVKATLVTDQLLASIPLVCGLLVITQKEYYRSISSVFERLMPARAIIRMLPQEHTLPTIDTATFPSRDVIHFSSQLILSCHLVHSETQPQSQTKDCDEQSDDHSTERERHAVG